MSIWRWLLVIPAAAVVLPLLGIAVVVMTVFPPGVTAMALAILTLAVVAVVMFRRSRSESGAGLDGEASLLPTTKAKGGLL